MSIISTRKAIHLSTRLYQRLIRLYPLDFRRDYEIEMVQLFDDLCRDAATQHGLSGFIRLWLETISDLLKTAVREHHSNWRNKMQLKKTISLATGAIILAYSLSFALINILKYSLGLSNLWNPFASIVDNPQPTLFIELLNLLVIIGPVLALGLFLLPSISVKLNWRSDQLATIVIHKNGRLSMVLIGLCLLVGVIFTLYFIAENLPCLIGSQISC